MHFTVGGRSLELTMAQVGALTRELRPEPIREHLVEIHGTVFPPKQVLAAVTGWERQSFTTMEAQRVLNRLGFVCRRVGQMPDGRAAWVLDEVGPDASATPDSAEVRLARLELEMSTARAAIAGFDARLVALERAVTD